MMMGIDDAFYRTIGMALAPEQILPQVLKAVTMDDDDERIRLVCDHIKAHISEPLGLTHLEQVFGRGARSLQMAFLKRIGVSPTRWIRDMRWISPVSGWSRPKQTTRWRPSRQGADSHGSRRSRESLPLDSANPLRKSSSRRRA